MSLKRYFELISIGDPHLAAQYRKSFSVYNLKNLRFITVTLGTITSFAMVLTIATWK